MKYAFLILMSALFLFQFSNDAEADEDGVKAQELFFYSDTTIPTTENDKLSLCHLAETSSKFGINFWRSMESYVLSKQNCEGFVYLNITPEQFAKAKEAGMIPSDTPDEPTMSLAMVFGGFYGFMLGGIVILAAFFVMRYKKKNSPTLDENKQP